jgi:beta-phosphoglucomutase family hydrolase
MARTWGAIFDWDGVVIDSSERHEESWHCLAAELGKALPEGFFKQSFGMKNQFTIPNILGWSDDPVEIQQIAYRKEVLYRELVGAHGLEPLPGVREWLGVLAEADVPCAVGSSTPRANIDFALGLIDLAQFFSGIVSAEDVVEGKPHPDVFLKAAAKIGRVPQRCVVFEDAHVGVQAARAGGMRVVAVATTNPPSAMTAADRVVERLDELTIDGLDAWFPEPAPAAAVL